MSVSLKTPCVADAHLAEGQVLREEPTVNREKSLKFLAGMQMPTVSSKEGQKFKTINKKNCI
jgi:hypothetical protein